MKTVHVWSPKGCIRVRPATGQSRLRYMVSKWAHGDSNDGPHGYQPYFFQSQSAIECIDRCWFYALQHSSLEHCEMILVLIRECILT